MNYIILGAGTVGLQIAEQLISEDKDVVLIEKDPDRARNADEHLDCQVINEIGNNVEALKEAGIENCAAFISVTDSDEVNMISCLLVASEFNVPMKIARVRNTDYSKSKLLHRPFIGIDNIVNPEIETARAIVNTVEQGAISDVLLFEDSDIQARTVYIGESSRLAGHSLEVIRRLFPQEFLVVGILRQDQVIIPHGQTVIRKHDHVDLIATRRNMEKIFAGAENEKKSLQKIVLVGGGKIGSYVAELLTRKGKTLKIIEQDYELAKKLSARFPQAMVIKSDISNEDIFHEENLGSCDLIITTTNNQELNILAALYGKSTGIPRAIALVTKKNYLNIASSVGINSTVNPKICTVDAILKYIRRGNIKTIHTIFDGKAEILQFQVDQDHPFVGRALKDLDLPVNTLVASVQRGKQTFIPGGEFVVRSEDLMIVFADNSTIPRLEELLAGRQ